MHFGAQSRGLRAPCERFAPWVTPGPRITRFRLAADLGRMGLDTHRVSNKVSKITSRHLVPLDRAFPAHALVHGSRALGEPRSTSWPSWRQQVHDLDMKSRVHPKYKTKYHVGNWPAYDRALVKRGDITVWLAPDAIATWETVGVGKRGGQRQYSDLAIETALTLRLIFHLSLRQTEGFLTSIFGMLGLELSTPDHTTLSRRGQHLDLTLRRAPAGAGLHLMVDSTGLSIVGEGEWAAAKHGGRGRRGWKKLHLGVDRSGVIVARALPLPIQSRAIAWLPGPAGTRRRVAKPSVEEPDAAEPARPDLWGARVSNDPGLPDRDETRCRWDDPPPRPAGRRESSTWISMFPRLGSSRLPKTSRFEAAVPVPMSTRPNRVPSR